MACSSVEIGLPPHSSEASLSEAARPPGKLWLHRDFRFQRATNDSLERCSEVDGEAASLTQTVLENDGRTIVQSYGVDVGAAGR
jgi:hypothetical protein